MQKPGDYSRHDPISQVIFWYAGHLMPARSNVPRPNASKRIAGFSGILESNVAYLVAHHIRQPTKYGWVRKGFPRHVLKCFFPMSRG